MVVASLGGSGVSAAVDVAAGAVQSRAQAAQVGDLVEVAEGLEDREADLVRVDLRRPGLAHRLLDGLRQHGQVGVGHGPALACLADARHDLLAAERLDHAGALDDVEARRLDRREPSPALGALPAATDAESVIARAGIDDAGVGMAAERAVHDRTSFASDEPWTPARAPSDRMTWG